MERIHGFFLDNGPRMLTPLAILVVGYFVAKIIAGVMKRVLRRAQVDETLTKFLGNIVYMLLMALVVISALGRLGVNTASFAAIIAAAGLAIGFALKDSLGNFASGVMLIALRPFKIGDLVEVGGVTGIIQAVNIFATELDTTDNQRIIVPNGTITSNNIVNHTSNGIRRLDMVFGIGYGDDIKQAKELFERVLSEEPTVLKEPAPQVAVSELADSSVNFVVRPWVQAGDYWGSWFAITEKIKLACDAEGVSIPFPQRDVHLHTVGSDQAA